VTRIDPTDNTPTTITVGAGPYDVTYAAGAAWVTNYSDDTVSRIAAASSKVSTIKVGAAPTGIAPAAGAVWVTNQTDGSLSRIDPSTLKVTTKKFGLAPRWTAWGDGSLWIADLDKMIEVNLQTGRPMRTVPLSGQPNDGDIVDGTVWVSDTSGNLHAINAKTGKVLGHWPLHLTDPFVLASYGKSLWVVDFKGTNLDQLDPATLLASNQ
jgi:YVTN family beta-propeller protein